MRMRLLSAIAPRHRLCRSHSTNYHRGWLIAIDDDTGGIEKETIFAVCTKFRPSPHNWNI